ncbi:hypothetical protein OFO10_06035 [Campylobacter sp. VBCF_06 NA8]|nr:hypothetical protein [Campylobacter sp. VBCF_06 NA8]MDA3046714.1 hypothetical protein [Campylobacter sp. VBCF_06 NA8]
MGMLTFLNLRKSAKEKPKSEVKKEVEVMADEKKSALKSSKKKVKDNG